MTVSIIGKQKRNRNETNLSAVLAAYIHPKSNQSTSRTKKSDRVLVWPVKGAFGLIMVVLVREVQFLDGSPSRGKSGSSVEIHSCFRAATFSSCHAYYVYENIILSYSNFKWFSSPNGGCRYWLLLPAAVVWKGENIAQKRYSLFYWCTKRQTRKQQQRNHRRVKFLAFLRNRPGWKIRCELCVRHDTRRAREPARIWHHCLFYHLTHSAGW